MSTFNIDYLLDVTRTTMVDAGCCFLTTLDEYGNPITRLMQPFDPEADLTVWMGASPKSRKVQQIRQNPQAVLGYALPAASAYVALYGQAEVVEDLELRQRYWRTSFAAYWPGGPAGDDYVLIRFTPARVELMNDARGVTPEPYGLQPAFLLRRKGRWEAIVRRPSE